MNCIAAYQPKGAADLAASYVNLANPGTYNAAPGSAPGWDAVNGWKPNGSSHYLTTGITPANTWSVLVRVSNLSYPAGVTGIFGFGRGANRFYLTNINGTFYWGNSGVYTAVISDTSAVFGFSNRDPYKNGIDLGTITNDGTTNEPIYLMAIYYDGSPAFYSNYYQQAFAIYDTALSAPQMAAVTTAMNLL